MAFNFQNFGGVGGGGVGNGWWGRFFIGIRQFIVSLTILAGGLFFSSFILGLVQYFNLEMLQVMAIAGPYSMSSWAVFLVMMAGFPLALAVWVFGDAKKFEKQGVKSLPLLWAIGTALPTILIVFPIYYVLRDVVWREKFQLNFAESGDGRKS